MMLDEHGFDKWAGSYDDGIKPHVNTFPFIGYYDVLAAVVALVEPRYAMRVLDVGIGTGLLSEELANRGCVIHGVDFSTKMLEQARRRIPGGLFDAVDVSKDHFGRFKHHQFDRVISSYFFHHFTIEQKTLFIKRTLRDNLSSGGAIVLADVGFTTEAEHRAARIEYRDKWDDDEFYLCGETIVQRLEAEKIVAEYRQVSRCAGILTCRK